MRRFFRWIQSSTLVQKASQGTLVIVLSSVINIFFRIFTSNLFEIEIYGTYIYVFTWIDILSLIGVMGANSANLRFVAVYQNDPLLLQQYIRYAFIRMGYWTLFFSMVLAVAGIGVSLGKPEQLRLFLLGLGLLPMRILLLFLSGIFLAYGNVVVGQGLASLFRAGGVIIGVVGLDTLGVLLQPHHLFLIEMLICVGLLLFCANRLVQYFPLHFLFQRIPQKNSDTTWHVSMRELSISFLFQNLARKGDVLLLGVLLDVTSVAVYQAAFSITNLVSFGLSGLDIVVAPRIARLYSQKDFTGIQRQLSLVALLASVYALASVIGIVVFGEFLLRLFGEEFTVAYPLLLVLVMGSLVSSLTGSNGYLAIMTGNTNVLTYGYVVGFGIAAVGNIVLIPQIGVIASALVASLSFIVTNFFVWYIMYRRTQLDSSIFSWRKRV